MKGCKHRLDGARSWDYSGHQTVEHSSRVRATILTGQQELFSHREKKGCNTLLCHWWAAKPQMPFRPG